MNISKTGVLWRETGFRLEALPAPTGELITVQFDDLNPQVQFRQRFTRWEMIRLGLWFLRSALKKEHSND